MRCSKSPVPIKTIAWATGDLVSEKWITEYKGRLNQKLRQKEYSAKGPLIKSWGLAGEELEAFPALIPSDKKNVKERSEPRNLRIQVTWVNGSLGRVGPGRHESIHACAVWHLGKASSGIKQMILSSLPPFFTVSTLCFRTFLNFPNLQPASPFFCLNSNIK